MKKRFNFWVMAMICQWSFTSTNAQVADSSGWRELDKIYEAYNGSLKFDGTIKVFSAQDSTHTLEEMSACYAISPSVKYYQLGQIEIVENQRYYLNVNHLDKIVFIAGSHHGAADLSLMGLNMLKSQLQDDHGSVSVRYTDNDHAALSVTFENDFPVKNYNVFYSVRTHLVDRISGEIWDEDDTGDTSVLRILDMRYSNYRHVDTAELRGAMRKYVRVNGKNAVLSPAYRTYHIISQL